MSFFTGFKFRIGAKLAVSAGLGVLFVGAMLANQIKGSATVAASSDLMGKMRIVSLRAAEIKSSVRGMMIGTRDLRLAQAQPEAQRSLSDMQARQQAMVKFADEALQLASLPENRARLQKIKDLSATYRTAAEGIGAAKLELIGITAKRQENGDAWRRAYAAAGEAARQANAADIVSGMREVSEVFGDARSAGWRYMATGEEQQVERALQTTDKGLGRLRELRAATAEPRLSAAIDNLLAVVTDFASIMNRVVELTRTNDTLMKTRALPLATEMSELSEKTLESAIGRAEKANTDAVETSTTVDRLGIGVGAFVILVLIGSAVFGALSIGKPIRRIAEVLTELGNGNKQIDVPYVGRGDEVGDAANAANTFKENLVRIEKMEAEQKEAEIRAAAQRKADMHKLADDFQAAVGNIVETVSSASTELEAAAGTLTKTADVTQELSGAVAAASEQASANVQSVASATEEMTSSVNEISRQVQESSKIANDAVKQAHATDARINELSQAAGRIGDVVKLITAIAEQTNLLALNATIEAARAGEAGRGFAVVASEVKQLASQTAKATDEIGTQIAGMQSATQESVAAIKEIGGTIGRISQIASTIAAAVEEQGAATQEIARNVGEAAKGTAQVANNITDVNRGAGETGSASAQVLSSAQSLSSESSHLRAEVDKFLMTVRAA